MWVSVANNGEPFYQHRFVSAPLLSVSNAWLSRARNCSAVTAFVVNTLPSSALRRFAQSHRAIPDRNARLARRP